MKVKLNAYPVVYFTVKCTKHECWVEVRPNLTKEQDDVFVVAGQLTAIQCQVGGSPRNGSCVDSWELTFSGGGDVTISS